MNRIEYLLQVLSEECAEVSKECSKSLRFGLNNHAPSQSGEEFAPTNREKIAFELSDLLAVADMLVESGVLPKECLVKCPAWDAKKKRVEKYMLYSQTVGTCDK